MMARQVRPWLEHPRTSAALRVRESDWEPASRSHQGQRQAPQQKSGCTGAIFTCESSRTESLAKLGASMYGRSPPGTIGQERSYAPRANCSRHSTMPARSIAVQVAAAVGWQLVPTLYLHRPTFDDPIDRSCSPINRLTGTRLSLGTQVRPNVGHYCRRAAGIWCGLIVITRSQQSSPVTA
jgi:hypothetical protein